MLTHSFRPLSFRQCWTRFAYSRSHLVWPRHAWFPTLLELLRVHPRRLPEWDHLLWHPLGRVYHNSPSFYKLHAWKLSGASSEQNNLLRGGEPWTLISQSGLSTKLGLGKKGFIQSFPLFPSWWIFSTTFSQKGNFQYRPFKDISQLLLLPYDWSVVGKMCGTTRVSQLYGVCQ
jgi:hypothetical protein